MGNRRFYFLAATAFVGLLWFLLYVPGAKPYLAVLFRYGWAAALLALGLYFVRACLRARKAARSEG